MIPRTVHVLLVAVMTAVLAVAVPPTAADAALAACDGGTVGLGAACTVDLATTDAEPFVGALPNTTDTYLVRVVALTGGGDFDPQVHVGPTTGDQANAECSAVQVPVVCEPGGADTNVWVEDVDNDDTGTAAVYVQDLDAPVGCVDTTDVDPWGDDGDAWSVDGGDLACRTFTHATAQRLVVDVGPDQLGTLGTLYDGDGAAGCESLSTNSFLDCAITAGSYVLVAFGIDGTDLSGRFHVYDRTSTTGCTTLPTNHDIAATSANVVPGGYDCHLPQTSGTTPRINYVVDADETLLPLVVDGDGDQQCGIVELDGCVLDGPGDHKLLVGSNVFGASGDYDVLAVQLSTPRNCDDHDLGDQETVTVPAGVRFRCFDLDADPGDTIEVDLEKLSGAGSSGAPLIIGGNGADACKDGASPLIGCELDIAGPYALRFQSAGPVTYRFGTNCDGSIDACGTGTATLDMVVPDEIGADGTATITVTGQNLDQVQRLELVGPGGTYTSVEQDDIDLGRTSSGVFELSDAQPGLYDVRHVTADRTSVLEDAIVIAPTEAPDITVTISGPGATRPDRPVTLTIQVTNDGNVDALGVPVFFEVPAGADVEFVGMEILRPDVPDVFGDVTFGDGPNSYEHSNGTFAGGATDGAGNATGGGGGMVSVNDMPVLTDVHPLIIPFVPARGRINVTARVTPRDPGNQSVSATGGECFLGTPHDDPDAPDDELTEDEKCAKALGDAFFATADLGIGIIPGADCATSAAQGMSSAIRNTYEFARMNPSQRNRIAFGGDMLLNGIGVAGDCVGELNVPAQVLLTAYDAFNAGYAVGTAIAECLGTPQWVHDLFAFFSFDPNDITGPAGVGDDHHVLPTQDFGYTVRFENDPEEATAAAQTVTIEVPIDDDLDASTIRIASFGFGDVVRTPLLGSLPFRAEVPLTAAQTPPGVGALRVDVDATLDGDVLEVVFDTRAPDGGEPGILDGFLPPNETSPEGEGFVVYALEGDLADGDVVTAQADIVFDTNDPIVTNTWRNVVDGRAPTATIDPLSLPPGSPRAAVAWDGDDGTGAGVERFDVEVSTDGGTTWTRWRDGTRTTGGEYIAPRGTTLVVRARATDALGQVGTYATSAPVTVPVDAIDRLAGASRVDTALAVSRASFDHALAVVLARADAYPDALAGAPLAYRLGGPLLLTDKDTLSPGVLDEIVRLGARRVVVLGGEAAVSPAVVAALAPTPGQGEVALGLEIERVAGASRFDTAALVADRVTTPGLARAYVVEGTNPDPGRGWPDALAVAPVAARQGAPILLTARDVLPDETTTALRRLAPVGIDIVGGEVAVSAVVEEQLRAIGPGVRIAGNSRYDTGIATSALGAVTGATPTVTWFATGRSFPDALAAGPAVAAAGDRLLLVDGADPAKVNPNAMIR